MTVTIYHNPRCSKSRQTLALIEAAGITPEVVKYLDTPLDRATLSALITRSGLPVADFFRAGEAEAKAQGLTKGADPEALLDAIAQTPKLMERPLVVSGKGVVLGRPPENVKTIL